MRAHQERFLLSIYNLTKHDGKTGNIYRFLNYVREVKGNIRQIHLSDNDIQTMENRIDEYRALINKAYKIREQHIVHNKVSRKELTQTISYECDEAEKLITAIKDAVNRVCQEYIHSLYSLDVIPTLNVKNMLDNLFEYRKQKEIMRNENS